MIENHYDNWRLEAENDYSLYDFYPSETSDSEAYYSLLTAVVEEPEAVFSVESDFPVFALKEFDFSEQNYGKYLKITREDLFELGTG